MDNKLLERITQHGEAVKHFFNLPADTDPVKLCKQLRRLEVHANLLATQYCNGEIDEDLFYLKSRRVMANLAIILCKKDIEQKVFFNADARGYALKIESEYVPQNFYRDMGGYGIIAPNLSEGGVR